MDRLTRQHISVIEQQERDALREHAKKLAAALADATGYLASVRTDRRHEQAGETFVLQTLEWAEGAEQFAAKANELLEKHDEFHL